MASAHKRREEDRESLIPVVSIDDAFLKSKKRSTDGGEEEDAEREEDEGESEDSEEEEEEQKESDETQSTPILVLRDRDTKTIKG